MRLAPRPSSGSDRFTCLHRGGRLFLVAALAACGTSGSPDVGADGTGPPAPAPSTSGSPTPAPVPSAAGKRRDSTVADVVRRYYAAIEKGDTEAAYALWRDGGRASGKSRAELAAGFAQTERVRVDVGDDVVIEGAAGSQYATVPVTVDATLRDGRHQHFEGTYTLRRSMVDGATAEQRRWRIDNADLRER